MHTHTICHFDNDFYLMYIWSTALKNPRLLHISHGLKYKVVYIDYIKSLKINRVFVIVNWRHFILPISRSKPLWIFFLLSSWPSQICCKHRSCESSLAFLTFISHGYITLFIALHPNPSFDEKWGKRTLTLPVPNTDISVLTWINIMITYSDSSWRELSFKYQHA